MASTFLVHITLPEFFSPRFVALLPRHRKKINELLEKRVILSYSLDMDRRNVWVFIQTNNESEIIRLISNFPILNEVTFEVKELAFHDTAPIGLPELIMN